MKRIRFYRKIILFEIGVLVTLILHYFVTDARGYKAIGGEFLLVPLIVVAYHSLKAIKSRWKETEEYFKRKEELQLWKSEGRKDYAK